MADGYSLPLARDTVETQAPTTPKLSPQLDEAIHRGITDFDLAAYDKNDFTENMERSIMRRFFDTFDVFQRGQIGRDEVQKLCGFLGASPDIEQTKLFSNTDAVTFDNFWVWWQHYSAKSHQAFSLVQSHFKAPYHQQQLIAKETGDKFTPSYRVSFFFQDVETREIVPASPWHDIPLHVHDLVRVTPAHIPSNRYNFICEIPKWTRAKFEIATGEAYNPIKQDMKNGVPRFYKHGDMMWNYGAFPQTWESTEETFEDGAKGDNDPVDAIEIGMTQIGTGGVVQVKVLGVLGMIDDGEMDWKVIVIAHSDPVAKFLDDIDDVPKYLPGCLGAIREWLRVYKICQGGEENKFAFDGEFKNKQYAMKVLHESHLMWANLKKISGRSEVSK